jgi:hypothetical protein
LTVFTPVNFFCTSTRAELFAREQTEAHRWGALGNDINHFEKIEQQQRVAQSKHERAHKKRRKE